MKVQRRRFPIVVVAALSVLTAACVNLGTDEDPDEVIGSNVSGMDDVDGTATATDGGGDGGAVAGELPVGALADPASLASIEAATCSFDELVPLPVRPSCYAVSVPENWAAPDPDDRVVLQVAVFEGDGSLDDPLIYFDGGPGGHTLDSLSFSYLRLIDPLLDARDFIVFDQRGVGTSEPALDCPEVTEVTLAELAGEIDPSAGADATLAALGACRERLEASGVDLAAYNSVASANDVEAIRGLLGQGQLNVIGISYGTRLAQTYLRMYPDAVRSVVLDSIFPTEADLWSNFVPGAVRAFEQLFRGCAENPACAEAYPDLEARFFALLDRLDAEPAEVELRNLVDGDTLPGVFDGDDVMGLVFSALYDRTLFSVVPAMVAEAESGDDRTIGLLGSVQLTNLAYLSEGMQLSVECNEEIPFESEEVLDANTPEDAGYARLQRVDGDVSVFEQCAIWPAGRAPDVEDETVSSDVPALLLAGRYDPITPPSGADTVAGGLANHYSFLFPHDGHGIVTTECGAELVSAFVDDPTVEPDGSCISDTPEPVWVAVPNEGPVELVEFASEGLVAISGVRPASWTDAGNGVFARQRTALDPTTLAVQPTGGLDPATLVRFLGGQAGIEFTEDEPLVIEGQEWTAFRGADGDQSSARLAASPGPDGVMVLLIAEPDEIDALFESVFLPAAAAARVG
jgi:pimeloyl-ACP methyl ester carboxylesterase